MVTSAILASPLNKPNSYLQSSTSVLVCTGRALLDSIFVSSSSSGTFQIFDSLTASGTTAVETFTAAAATRYEFKDVEFNTGIYIKTTNSPSFTVIFKYK